MPTWEDTRERCELQKAEELGRILFSVFSPEEVVILLDFLLGVRVSVSTLYEARSALSCGDKTISPAAGRVLVRLCTLLRGPEFHKGGALFLVAHATRSAFDSPNMERGELQEVLAKATSNPAVSDAWIVDDGLVRMVKGKLKDLVSWDTAEKLLSGGLNFVANRLTQSGGAGGLIGGLLLGAGGQAIGQADKQRPALATGHTKSLPAPAKVTGGVADSVDLVVVDD